MLSKCANPVCLAPFRYLHEGRIFNVETGAVSAEGRGSAIHRIEHFWLCERCAQILTIVFENGVVSTRPLRFELAAGAPQEKPDRKRDVA